MYEKANISECRFSALDICIKYLMYNNKNNAYFTALCAMNSVLKILSFIFPVKSSVNV